LGRGEGGRSEYWQKLGIVFIIAKISNKLPKVWKKFAKFWRPKFFK
jgi:hypothetical protein